MDEERKNKDIDIEEIVTDNLEENESKIEENTAELNDFDKIDEDYTDDILYKKTDLGESIQEDVVEEKEKVKQNKEKSNKYKYLIYLSIILLITVVVLWYNLVQPTKGPDGSDMLVYETIPDVVSKTNVWYFLLLIGSVIFGFFIAALIIWTFAKLYTKHYKMHQAFANALIGSFYSAITPGASGGQFAFYFCNELYCLPMLFNYLWNYFFVY